MKAVTDQQIHREVLRQLELDDRVKHTEIGVQVEDGIVTLSGIVSGFAKKVAACSAAHRARNVRYVANNLQLRDIGYSGISDTDVAAGVRAMLEGLAIASRDRIHITVGHGMVAVEGTIADADERSRVIEGVRAVEGALVVIDMLAEDIATSVDRQVAYAE